MAITGGIVVGTATCLCYSHICAAAVGGCSLSKQQQPSKRGMLGFKQRHHYKTNEVNGAVTGGVFPLRFCLKSSQLFLDVEENDRTFQRFHRNKQPLVISGSQTPALLKAKRHLVIMFATVEEIQAEKDLIEEDAMERMEKAIESVKSNFNTIRTGRASPSLLDRVEVEYYGSPVILKSIAQVSTPDGSTVLVQPFDKSSLAAIERAIMKSDTGLNPSNDGNVIRLNIPQLTAERRKELLKLVSKLSEDGKVAIRNVRRDAIKAYEKLEKEKKISEDNSKDLSAEIQKLTDDYVKKIDTIFKQKEKELTTV
ncbi:hypothetical protein O6H91_11G031800 [Diphasiastrum complanatum]|uniref:Uncharacterized protein n=1 Tax=Diphasiastrum complanatum TaxID=34168 RepID=A0ACC2C7S0_DIPCM|nr:hypothetical protein O6H91_11G031800 [Diphasiastrum complanatum]